MKANAIGRSSKTVREFLEKNHKDGMAREEAIKLTVKSLLEVVQTGAKNIEISVMESYGKITVRIFSHTASSIAADEILQSLDLAQIEEIVAEIEREKEAGTLFHVIFYKVPPLTNLVYRGREEAFETCCHRCWPSSHESTSGRWSVRVYSLVLIWDDTMLYTFRNDSHRPAWSVNEGANP